MYIRHFAYSIALVLSQPAAASMAPPAKYKPGNVIVAFEGGLVGEELGKVMLALAKGENLLPTKPYVVVASDTPCVIAARQLSFPQPCSASFLNALDLLNPKTRPSRGRLRIGQTILLPDVWLRSYRTTRSFANAIPAERNRSVTIQKNWSHLKTGVAKSSSLSAQVDFDAYELILPSTDPVQHEKLMERVRPYESVNVRVTSIGFQGTPAKAYSVDAARYEADCRRDPSTPVKVHYRDYADTDGDLTSLISQRPVGSRAAKVYLLDVPLVSTPNIAGAVDGNDAPAGDPNWRCAWSGRASKLQHATHLAGIIASRDNGFGFVGLAPTSKIVSFQLLKPSASPDTVLDIPAGTEWMLADKMLENMEDTDPSLSLYLIAASLSPYPRAQLNQAGQIDKMLRFRGRPVEQRIHDLRPLFVVAAGQASGQSEMPIALAPSIPISPQNLGDERNVLVVTACERCTRKDPLLMPTAHFGTDARFVHVAAPGGSPMLGWVDGSGVGLAQGTSQAAAYAAGVIAEMIGRWPDSFAQAYFVKKRIQATAWPIYERLGQPNDDYKKVATGIVDPALALLNPRAHWLKDSSGWHEVKLKGFSTELSFRRVGTNSAKVHPANSVLRVLRVSPSGETPQWILYTDVSKTDDVPEEHLGEVARRGPLEAVGNIALVPCEGPPIPLSEVIDLVVANTGIGANQCGA